MKTFNVFISVLALGLILGFCPVSEGFAVPINQGTQNAAINIGSPVLDIEQGMVASEQSIAISGTAHAKSYVLLYVNGQFVSETQATSSAGGLEGEGAFAFADVQLAEGENEIYVVSCLGRNKSGFEIYSEPIIVYYEPYGKKIIGTEGGTLISRDLAFELVIPAGALQAKTLISVERLDTPPGEIIYELQPSGLAFSQPASIILNLTEEEMGWFGPKVIKVYLEGEDGSKEELPCIVDEETGEITTAIEHFSRIAIDAPLQFVDYQFKSKEKTWTEGVYTITREEKWLENWDIGAGRWWLKTSSLNRFKGVKFVLEGGSYYENLGGSIKEITLDPLEKMVMSSVNPGGWDIDAFQDCNLLAWHWNEWFQCGSAGIGAVAYGVIYSYWHERAEYSASHKFAWEIKSITQGRLELLATSSTNPETHSIHILKFGQ